MVLGIAVFRLRNIRRDIQYNLTASNDTRPVLLRLI